jgi:hypothetical protein
MKVIPTASVKERNEYYGVLKGIKRRESACLLLLLLVSWTPEDSWLR